MSRNKEKGTLVEADPEPEKTLKRKSRKTKNQQFRETSKKREKRKDKKLPPPSLGRWKDSYKAVIAQW